MDQRDQLVVLLHGIARTSLSMRRIEKALAQQNYATLNINYPSRSCTIDILASHVHEELLAFPNFEKLTVHFVTHSMGGLVVRALLAKQPLMNVQKVVMLGPPNQGSEVADFIEHYQPFKAFYGPALAELTKARASSQPFPLLPSHTQVGIIAGSLNIDPFCYFILPKGHDGKVSIASTELAGMADHLVLPISHSFMMYNNEVLKQINHFLLEGRFLRSSNAPTKTHVK